MAVETLFAQKTHEALIVARREAPLLPICCLCRLIREETGVSLENERWITQRTYGRTHGINPPDCLLTHTYCPQCFAQVMDRMRGRLSGSLTGKPR
jgi:hypothetical protein